MDKKKEVIEPSFDDAKYSQDMRVDKLTTIDAMRQELADISEKYRVRKEIKDKRKAEEEAQEREQFLAWKASKSEQKHEQDEGRTRE